MANNNIFSPPSADEIKALKSSDLFAPPSASELKPVKSSAGSPSAAGVLESFGAGVAKVSPESLAGIQAAAEPAMTGLLNLVGGAQNKKAADVLSKLGISDPSVKDFKGRKAENVARQEQFKKDFPMAQTVADIAGQITGGGALGAAIPAVSLAGKGLIGGARALAPAAGAAAAMGAIRPESEYGGISEPIDFGKRGQAALTDAAFMSAFSAVPAVLGAAKKGLKSVSSSLSGVTPQEMETFAARTEQVKDLYNRGGKDFQAIADEIRDNTLGQVRVKKAQLNSQIENALESASPEKIVAVQPFIDALESYKGKISPKLAAKDYAKLIEAQQAIAETAGETGLLSLKELKQTTEFLQDLASAAYTQPGLVNNADRVSKFAKSIARDARKVLNQVSPEIADANNQLSLLHKIDDSLTRNVLKEGATTGTLFAAGSGVNKTQAKLLQKLDEAVGSNALQSAQDMAAARTFLGSGMTGASPFPMQSTGRSLLGTGLGYALGGPTGAAVAGGLSSPLAIRTAIEGVNLGSPLFKKITELTGANPQVAGSIMNVLRGEQNTGDAVEFFKNNPKLIEDIPNAEVRMQMRQQIKEGVNPLQRRLEKR
jgi:hypothetical protein